MNPLNSLMQPRLEEDEPFQPFETRLESWLDTEAQANQIKVEQRVIGQLFQTLLYEGVLEYEMDITDEGEIHFTTEVIGASGQRILYRCSGLKSDSFDLIRLNFNTMERILENGVCQSANLNQVMGEIFYNVQGSPYLPRFINEIEQTFIKDMQSRSQGYKINERAHLLSSEALEQHFMDAHSYHPCYKSRVGFSLTENVLYGPEFGRSIQPIWLAISKQVSAGNVSEELSLELFLRNEAGEENWQKFHTLLKNLHKSPDDYTLVPVHPWQWEHIIMPSFAHELLEHELIYIGRSVDQYQAQQSLRTLQNITDIARPYVKFSLSMTNTSSTRILAKHTVLNGPIITDWLHKLINNHATSKRLDFVILREIAGVSFDQESLPTLRKTQTYGALGTIWRESIHQYLRKGETAVPFNGLSQLENQYSNDDVVPFIDAWVETYSLDSWYKQLLKVTVQPIIHMLYAEGIGMESHGQNIVLITRDGWPQRVALKDFHDGVRYSLEHLGHPELAPDLSPIPASHAKLNRNSFIITEESNAVRDFSCDCFFFICLSDIAIFLKQNYQLPETQFWGQVSEVIQDYQAQHPELQDRFELFDLYAENYEVEELTKRRLLGDEQRRFKQVPNPLYSFRTNAC